MTRDLARESKRSDYGECVSVQLRIFHRRGKLRNLLEMA